MGWFWHVPEWGKTATEGAGDTRNGGTAHRQQLLDAWRRRVGLGIEQKTEASDRMQGGGSDYMQGGDEHSRQGKTRAEGRKERDSSSEDGVEAWRRRHNLGSRKEAAVERNRMLDKWRHKTLAIHPNLLRHMD